ncbi:MAG TPA: class I adenylate-forming enzyme family protein [Acidimicrobiia bacterium]|nr:class I adenylate-forming enzyme family protein [Acidimicrobiia bacterium]
MTTLPALLDRNREARGDEPVMVTADRGIRHGELDEQSAVLAARLVAAGIGKGARLGVLLPNGIEWAVIACAAARVGAVIVPLSTLLRPPELATQLQIAAVTHLVVAREFRGRRYLDDLDVAAPGILTVIRAGGRHAALPALRAVWTGDDLPSAAVDAAIVHALEARVNAADDFVILFTSGSRGAPKGTMHTHGSALRAVASGLDARRITASTKLYIPMPFFWTGGLAGGLLSAIVAGATLLTESTPEADATLALLERERATLFRGWPDQAAALAAHPRFRATDLSSLGPASLPSVLAADRRPAPGARANLFGMTETFGPYCGSRLDEDMPTNEHGSCGRPFAGIEVRIVDREIQVRGNNLMRGICGCTRDATFTADGFYATGDLGSLDADGYLWYLGRRDDMFKVKGATVYPGEVEGALRAIDGVRQAHVTNVPGDRDEVGALVVSTRPVDELAAAAKARLSAFKVPTRWFVTDTSDDVPMTATAKVDKAALQDLLLRKGTAP